METYFPDLAERDKQLQDLLNEKARIEQAWLESSIVTKLINMRIAELNYQKEIKLDDE